jgi:uncharacterized membrane protein YdjX (TVP38/TMEM64 family)
MTLSPLVRNLLLKEKLKRVSHQNFSSVKRPDKQSILKTGLVVLVVLALAWYRTPIMEVLSLVGDREALLVYIGAFGPAGLAMIYLILSLQVILAAIPGHIIMLVSGYLYGFIPALIVTHVSTVIASQFAYWLARRYGRPVVSRLAPADLVDRWTLKAEKQGMVFFFFSFILPIFPSDVMNFVAGLSGLSTRKFLTANFVGRLPTSILFPLIGAQAFRITPSLLVVAVVYTLAMLMAWRYLTPYLEKQA